MEKKIEHEGKSGLRGVMWGRGRKAGHEGKYNGQGRWGAGGSEPEPNLKGEDHGRSWGEQSPGYSRAWRLPELALQGQQGGQGSWTSEQGAASPEGSL